MQRQLSPYRRRRAWLGFFVITFVVLYSGTGCTGTVAMEPAQDAANPTCADIVVRLPSEVDGLERRETNAQATAAWGDPSEVLLRCGVAIAEPTSNRCLDIDGVDWVIDETDPDFVSVQTYGRSPNTEVVIDRSHAGATTILADLNVAVSAVPATRSCE
jgi:hypothetical protein